MSTRAPTSAEVHLWAAQKYITTQFGVIPLESGEFLVGHCYGNHRTLFSVMNGPDLLSYLTTSFEHQLAQSRAQDAHKEALLKEMAKENESVANLDLGDISL